MTTCDHILPIVTMMPVVTIYDHTHLEPLVELVVWRRVALDLEEEEDVLA